MEKQIIIKILNDINPEIKSYKGNNLVSDHIISSFDIIEIISEIEDRFQIDIDPELITEDHFISMDMIVSFIQDVVNNSRAK